MNRFATLLLALTLLPLSGCSLFTTTADGIAAVGEGITQGTASTSDAISTEADETAALAEARRFGASQYPLLRRDAASGGGEYIKSLARLMNEPDPTTLGPWMQAHYHELFAPDAPATLVDRILARRG
ncbi:MAG: hypothetical protein CMN28_05815 [Salinisphaeraceae bacterium]|jgi:hypothetical protein|nr:hypothetical protein [Salinisphaeraceae bacterium]